MPIEQLLRFSGGDFHGVNFSEFPRLDDLGEKSHRRAVGKPRGLVPADQGSSFAP